MAVGTPGATLKALRDKVEFWQGDAHNLKEQFGDYDLVLACNLIDRLYDPARFLEHIAGRINPGGLLVILSPYTWLEEFTSKYPRKVGLPFFCNIRANLVNDDTVRQLNLHLVAIRPHAFNNCV